MPLTSDINVDATRFDRKLTDKKTEEFNEKLIKIWKDGPRWYEVFQRSMPSSTCHAYHCVQVGAAAYRKLRWDGKTPLPKPIVLPEGVNGTIPSRDAGRDITYRVFQPASGKPKGIHLHIHGGGWVLQSEA